MPVMRPIYLRRSVLALRSHGPAADATTICGTGALGPITSSREMLPFRAPSESAAARSQTHAHFVIRRLSPLLATKVSLAASRRIAGFAGDGFVLPKSATNSDARG